MRFALAILLALATAPALADEDTEQAKKLFKVAAGNFDLGRYEEALEEFEAAYEKKALPAFLFNIALCHRKLGHHRLAVEHFEHFLRELPAAPNRQDAEDMLAEERVAALTEPPPAPALPDPAPPDDRASAPVEPPPAAPPAAAEPADDGLMWLVVPGGVAAAVAVAAGITALAISAAQPHPAATIDLRGAQL